MPLAFLSGADFRPSAPHLISWNKMPAMLPLVIENQLNYGVKNRENRVKCISTKFPEFPLKMGH